MLSDFYREFITKKIISDFGRAPNWISTNNGNLNIGSKMRIDDCSIIVYDTAAVVVEGPPNSKVKSYVENIKAQVIQLTLNDFAKKEEEPMLSPDYQNSSSYIKLLALYDILQQQNKELSRELEKQAQEIEKIKKHV